MNVELRKVQIHEDMSDESTCFSAEIWVDGKKLAHVQNDGMGGSHCYQPRGGLNGPDWRAFEEHCKAQPHEYDFDITDQFIDKLLEEHT